MGATFQGIIPISSGRGDNARGFASVSPPLRGFSCGGHAGRISIGEDRQTCGAGDYRKAPHRARACCGPYRAPARALHHRERRFYALGNAKRRAFKR